MKFNLADGEYAVFGSALLDLWGLRRASDLDIIVTLEYFEKLRASGWEEHQGNGFLILRKGEADVTTVQDSPTDGDYYPDRIKLIKEATIINEVPFVKVEEVIACKKAYNRSKDLRDIKLLEDYINSQ